MPFVLAALIVSGLVLVLALLGVRAMNAVLFVLMAMPFAYVLAVLARMVLAQ